MSEHGACGSAFRLAIHPRARIDLAGTCDFRLDIERGLTRVRGTPDRSADDDVIGPVGDRLCRRRDAFLIPLVGAQRTHAGGDDQAAFGFGQGADSCGFLR